MTATVGEPPRSGSKGLALGAMLLAAASWAIAFPLVTIALTLMTPLMTIGLGVLITHDHFDLRMGLGASLALAGVLIVALRRNQVTPLLMFLKDRSQ